MNKLSAESLSEFFSCDKPRSGTPEYNGESLLWLKDRGLVVNGLLELDTTLTARGLADNAELRLGVLPRVALS